MNILYCINDLLNHLGDILFVALKTSEELSSFYILHHKEKMILIAKMSVEFDDIRMVHHVEYLDL